MSELDRLDKYGSSHELGDEVLKRAQQKLCFGRMMLPHHLMRLVLVEQVYQAVKINSGETYPSYEETKV